MSQPININTATLDELKTITGISDKRANKIIKRRQDKGSPLTLEDLKLMTDIPSTIWDPLIEAGTITLEPPEISQPTEANPMEQGQTQKLSKLIETLQKDVKDLKTEKAEMQSDFDHKMIEMNADFVVRMKNREHEFEHQQSLFAQKYKQEMESLIKESQEREEKLQQIIKNQEAEMKQLKTPGTVNVDDKAALEKVIENIVSNKEKEESKTTSTSTLGNILGKSNLQTKPYMSKGNKWSNDGPLPPKMGTYDGHGDWRPYFVQFNHIANRYKWTTQDRLDKLIECLRDRALNFFTSKPKSIQEDYSAICKKMDERFGRKDLPQVIRRQLQDLRQQPDESLNEYAERAQDLATDGYPGTPDAFIQIVATDAFLKGCSDKQAALTTMDKDPDTLDKALQYVKSAVTNQRVILGAKKADVKRVTFQDTDMDTYNTDEDSTPLVTTVRAMYKKNTNETDVSRFEDRLKKTEDDLQETKSNVKQILEILKGANQASKWRSQQRSPSPRRSPIRTGRCYNCGEEGHYSTECSRPRVRSPQRLSSRSRSPSPNYDRNSLNFKGQKA